MATRGNGTDKSNPASTTKANVEVACGLIMPISAIDGVSAEHWAEVKAILTEAIERIGAPRFAARLVSEADEVGVIQKRIIQNVYNSGIVVCDVSAKNPNVMFELGLRLAFDKPTVIIKDDKTGYSFDTGVIEHVPYPRDLRFSKMVDFKGKLAEKVLATYNAAHKDPSHSPFLRNFGQFHVASLPQTEVSADKLMMEMLSDIQRDVQVLRRRNPEAQQLEAPVIYDNEVVDGVRLLLGELGLPVVTPPMATDKKLVDRVRKELLRYGITAQMRDVALVLNEMARGNLSVS